ncbi:MAG: CHASE2 domain-containing protein [Bryobacteraceae bacterium]
MASKRRQNTVLYVAMLAGCFAVGFGVGLTSIGARFDDVLYDVLTRNAAAADAVSLKTSAVVVAIDEDTLRAQGGMRSIRPILTEALRQLAEVGPKVVASDVVLADAGDPAEDARLAAALLATKHLILPCELIGGKWEDPLPAFRAGGAALGHVHLAEQSADGVNRQIPLEKKGGGDRRWALSLEAFAAYKGQPIVESSSNPSLQIGATVIPETTGAIGRPMLVRYLPPHTIPTISALDIEKQRDRIRGSAVFLGITALSAARDRLTNSYGDSVSGVEVHAQAFETMRLGRFLIPSGDAPVLALCVAFTVAAGLIFVFVPGWWAYAVDALLLGAGFLIPYLSFQRGIVFPFFGPVVVAWLASAGAATFQYFFVRRQLKTSESEKSRYQQAIHWVAHEMRTPLTAIQGSSEIMTRYKLPEEKGKQLSEMINSESKRLARMIQTFLDVERLADGQMELKKEPFAAGDVVEACLKRVGPIAERKSIGIFLDTPVEAMVTGDRELMEYAFYNLLTNAVKYSPAETEIHVSAGLLDGELRLSVRDQGIGMDAQELKSIFKKFYRTKRAEASGEVGTGIGLSIVEQIVTHHHGRMEVASEPGKGSCFTIIVSASNPKVPPAAENPADSHNAETSNR